MADSIGKKLKGLFMSKNKKKKSKRIYDSYSGSQPPGSDEIADMLSPINTMEGKTPTEAPVAPDEESEEMASDEIESAINGLLDDGIIRVEKTHERVSRIASEMNTKGYGL